MRRQDHQHMSFPAWKTCALFVVVDWFDEVGSLFLQNPRNNNRSNIASVRQVWYSAMYYILIIESSWSSLLCHILLFFRIFKLRHY